jgi:hypothetical protein
VSLIWCGQQFGPEAVMRVVPPSPRVPRLISVTDATGLLAGPRITSGSIKVVFEELDNPDETSFWLDGVPLSRSVHHWADRRTPRLEIVLPVPPGTPAGLHHFEAQARKQKFPPLPIEVYW